MTDELQKLATLPLDQRGEALETLLQDSMMVLVADDVILEIVIPNLLEIFTNDIECSRIARKR